MRAEHSAKRCSTAATAREITLKLRQVARFKSVAHAGRVRRLTGPGLGVVHALAGSPVASRRRHTSISSCAAQLILGSTRHVGPATVTR